MFRPLLLTASLVAVAAIAPLGRANGWQKLKHQPGANASTLFLLPDGRLLMNEYFSKHWWIFTPDAKGSYLNGTWTHAADSHDDRLYYASGVLGDGRVIVGGGEYSNTGGSNKVEIYDPLADTWTAIPEPSGWAYIGDAPSTVLADGRFLMGNINDARTAIFDPATSSWTAAASVLNQNSVEETFILLPDTTVLAAECNGAPGSELYDPLNDVWLDAGTIPTGLVTTGLEIGPGMMMYTGDAFQMGGTPHSARYTPASTYAGVGTWVGGGRPPIIGPNRPGGADSPASILPNGNVLVVLSDNWNPPNYFLEYDGNNFIRVPDASNNNNTPFDGRMLPLPTGEVLYANQTIELYTADGSPDPAWRPTITSVASDLIPGESYVVSGMQLNGLSTANSYGDECGVATNYPLVRITNAATGHVFYCRAHDPSTMGIATGAATVSTHFVVPATVETGPSTLEVVANGIASVGRSVVVRAPITIDFDALATGVVVTNQYAEATFSAPAGFANWTVAQSGGTSQPNVIMTGPVGGGSDGLEDTYVDFPAPIASLTFQGVGVDNTGVVANVNVFENGVLTNTVAIEGAGDPTTPVRVDLTSFHNVTRIEIVSITDAGGIAWDDFNFCLASSASWSNYGSGFAGTLGVPSLTSQSNPVLGSSITLDLGNSLGATTPALLITGVQQTVVPTPKGGDLLVVPLLFVPLSLPATGATFNGSLPNDPNLCGVGVYAQALELDAGAAHGLSFTAGLQLVLGY